MAQTPKTKKTETEKIENLYESVQKSLYTLLDISPDDDKKGIVIEDLSGDLIAAAQLETLILLRDALNKLIEELP